MIRKKYDAISAQRRLRRRLAPIATRVVAELWQ